MRHPKKIRAWYSREVMVECMKNRFGALFACALLALPQGCSVGRSHTSDASLQRFFNQHRQEFEAVLSEVQADSHLKTLQRDVVSYSGRLVKVDGIKFEEVESLGLPKSRWIHYQEELQRLRLAGIMKSEHEIEFRVDPGTMFNGDSYKGYCYRATAPDRLLSSLDEYRTSDRDLNRFGGWLVFKPLMGDWFLYLFVNGTRNDRFPPVPVIGIIPER